jgi:hypothetical protein
MSADPSRAVPNERPAGEDPDLTPLRERYRYTIGSGRRSSIAGPTAARTNVKLGIFVVPDATEPAPDARAARPPDTDPIGGVRRLGEEVASRGRELVG